MGSFASLVERERDLLSEWMAGQDGSRPISLKYADQKLFTDEILRAFNVMDGFFVKSDPKADSCYEWLLNYYADPNQRKTLMDMERGFRQMKETLRKAGWIR